MITEPFDTAWFGEKAEHVTLYQAEAENLEEAKKVVLSKLEIATVDHDGKRLNERKWRYAMRLVGSL